MGEKLKNGKCHAALYVLVSQEETEKRKRKNGNRKTETEKRKRKNGNGKPETEKRKRKNGNGKTELEKRIMPCSSICPCVTGGSRGRRARKIPNQNCSKQPENES